MVNANLIKYRWINIESDFAVVNFLMDFVSNIYSKIMICFFRSISQLQLN